MALKVKKLVKGHFVTAVRYLCSGHHHKWDSAGLKSEKSVGNCVGHRTILSQRLKFTFLEIFLISIFVSESSQIV